MPISIFIRADSNSRIGIGHVLRCLAFAQAWQDEGVTARFIGRIDSSGLKERIIDEGFKFIPLCGSDLSNQEALKIKEIIEAYKSNDIEKESKPKSDSNRTVWIILDGYQFDTIYQKELKKFGYRILVMDDTALHSEYYADIIVNQNFNAKFLNYRSESHPSLLLGLEYATLLKNFRKFKDKQSSFSPKVKRILLSLGGSDSKNITSKIVQALNRCKISSFCVDIVVGPENLYIDEIRKVLISALYRFRILIDVKNMPNLMSHADMAICSGGTTCRELLYMRVPSMVIITSKNQHEAVESLHGAGAILSLGCWKNLDIEAFSNLMSKFIQDVELRRKLHENAKKLCICLGADQIVSEMKRKSN
ncbi:UDP-2,4-diacetamido-2,4,6-trideoxy-beta-L-altropyranose hydrolase [Candidatus Parcubacteria bacterium]|nr:MAG: UDP-2,4-diacetamido-2,4,6-trideoxy-beta-L-altropyranose hydrolase [Candidatus Parcubacteria bacterium]